MCSCPIDSFVFPELDKGRNGDTLEARFNAFKIPESNFLVFEATVRTCRDGCQPAYCPSGSGRSEPSFGRRRRSLNDTTPTLRPTDSENSTLTGEEESVQLPEPQHLKSDKTTAKPQLLMISSKDSAVSFLKTEKKVEQKKNSLEASSKEREEEPEFVREMIEVRNVHSLLHQFKTSKTGFRLEGRNASSPYSGAFTRSGLPQSWRISRAHRGRFCFGGHSFNGLPFSRFSLQEILGGNEEKHASRSSLLLQLLLSSILPYN